MALGETPNIAARVQGIAAADTVVISAATYRLVAGLVRVPEARATDSEGHLHPSMVYRIVGEVRRKTALRWRSVRLNPASRARGRTGIIAAALGTGQRGAGQVVLLSGEAGIGKSRLVQTLKEQTLLKERPVSSFAVRPITKQRPVSIINHLQRLLQFTPDDAPQTKLAKLQQTLIAYRFSQADTLPLIAALLSLPHPEGLHRLTLSPQKQKQKIQEALVAWIMEEAENAPCTVPGKICIGLIPLRWRC